VLAAVAISCAVAGALLGAALVTLRVLKARYSRMAAAAPLLVVKPAWGGAPARVSPAAEPAADVELATWTATV
jgi:hypothetical protein